jgi:site-specific recombinase XerD
MAMKSKKIPEVLTEDEVRLLLKQPNKRYPTGMRNLCLMRVMLDAGLRASEVIKLTVQDIDWRSGKLKVRLGKGAKDRVLWINEDLLELLRKWRERRPEGTDLLFPTLDGGLLDDRYLRQAVKRYGKKAGLSKNVHPHMLRHTFATDLYRQTKNIRLTQKALGHSDLSTTMIYTHLVDAELEDALKTFRSRATRGQG